MDTSILKALAVILIANSHLEDFYPFRPLAGDGLIGNSLFFLLSGLGLTLSPRTHDGAFVGWYRRRLSRIYPGLWLTVLIGMGLAQGMWREWTPRGLLRDFVWPTPYGFVAQIVLFYPAFYLLKVARDRRVELGALAGLAVAYASVAVFRYNLHVLSYIYYFQMMVLGGLLAGRREAMGRHARRDVTVLAAAVTIYLGLKLAMVTGRMPSHVAPLHILTLPIVTSLLSLCATPRALGLVRIPWLGPAIAWLGGLTLEIYLVHGYIAGDLRVINLPLPFNLAAFWAMTLPLAWALGATSDRMLRLIGSVARTGRAMNPRAAASRRGEVRTDPASTLGALSPAPADRSRPAPAGRRRPPAPAPCPSP